MNGQKKRYLIYTSIHQKERQLREPEMYDSNSLLLRIIVKKKDNYFQTSHTCISSCA